MKNSHIDRFISMISIDPNGCWEWLGNLEQGYGACGGTSAHRFAWILFKGPIRFRLHVLHKCDNRKCVSPSPLFLGYHTHNMKDMKKKHGHP